MRSPTRSGGRLRRGHRAPRTEACAPWPRRSAMRPRPSIAYGRPLGCSRTAPVERLAADAVGGAGKSDVAAPADPPREIAGALGVGSEGVDHRAERVAEPEVGDVLAVLVDEKRPGLEHEDAQRRPARPRALAVDLRRSVAAVHSRPDHHHIKVGIGRRLFIGAADEAPEDIEREGRPLDIRLARRKPLAGRRKLGQGHCAHLRYQGYVYDLRADEAQGAGRFPFKKNTARRFEIDIHLPATAAEQDWPLKNDRPHQRRVTRT